METQYTGNNIIKQGPNSTVATTFRTKKANKITKCTHEDGHILNPGLSTVEISCRPFATSTSSMSLIKCQSNCRRKVRGMVVDRS